MDKHREADLEIAKEKTIGQICKKPGVPDKSYYTYGVESLVGMDIE